MNDKREVIEVGYKFYFYEVVKSLSDSKTDNSLWLCKCVCGKTSELTTYTIRKLKPLGCMHCAFKTWDLDDSVKISDEDARRILLKKFHSIKRRCYTTYDNNLSNKYYRDKGIKMYSQWLKDPNKFIDWCLNNGWTHKLSIDRKDHDKGYYPDNCQFITIAENTKRMHEHQKRSRYVHYMDVKDLNSVSAYEVRFIDFTGYRVDGKTVIGSAKEQNTRAHLWEVLCKCGDKTIRNTTEILLKTSRKMIVCKVCKKRERDNDGRF